MDGYQFIADIFKSLVSLAWPAAFVVAIWIFRSKLSELMPLLRLKYKDLDVSFRLDQAEKEAKAFPAPAEPMSPTPEEANKFAALVKMSPRAAILERRVELQDALESFAVSVKMKYRPGNILQLTRSLRQYQLIDERTSALLDDLRVIGNKAAHDPTTTFTEEDALRFGEYSDRLIEGLRISAAAADNMGNPKWAMPAQNDP